MRLLVVFSALFLMAATPVFAATIDATGAAKLKGEVADALQFYIESGKTQQQGLRLSGDITVEPKKDFYEVKIPGVSVLSGMDRLDIGTIVVNATPGKDGEYLTAVAIPSPVVLKDAATGKGVSEFSFGTQKFAGAWYPALGTFTKVDAEYKNVVIKDVESKATIGTANVLKTILDLKKNADNTWSGVQKTTFKDIALTAPVKDIPNAQNKANVKKGTVDTIYDKIDLAQAKSLKDKMRAMYKNGAQPSSAEVKALLNEGSANGGMVDGMKNNIDISGITLTLPQRTVAGKTPEPVIVTLARLNAALDIAGVRQDTGNVTAKTNIDGFGVSGNSPEAQGLIPQTLTINAALTQLPIRDVSKIITNVIARSLDATPANATPEQRAAAQIKSDQEVEAATDEIMALLAKTGASLTISDTKLTARDANADLKGNVKAVPTASEAQTKAGFLGKMVLSLQGVDELLTKYQEKAKTGDKAAEKYVQFLSVLQMLGQQGTAGGKSARTFTFDLTPDGKLKMNGADISVLATMLQGMGGMKP